MTSTIAPPVTPTHNDASDRARAAGDLDVCIALDAGAGSGKTSVMVARLVALLERGTHAPLEVAAITFTEKAAGELLSRTRDLLEARLAAATAAEAAALAAVIDRCGELTISTIHAFCRDLLAHESLEADFAPDTEIGDDNAADVLLTDALRRWRDGLRVRRPELWTLIEQLVTGRQLKNAAAKLHQYRHYADVAVTEPFDPERAMTELREVVREIDGAAAACRDESDKLLVNTRALFNALADAAAMAPALQGVLAALLTSGKAPGNVGAAKAWGGKEGGKENKARYVAAFDDLDAWRGRWREHAHGEVVRDLRLFLLPILDQERRDAGIATFDDLLAEAAKLLRTNAVARGRLAERYRAILVDEVQDTDPVQAEIATLLARAIDDDRPWREASAEHGRLFAVGDPKQSIYRFRGADVQTFRTLREVIARNGATASLSRNFRSVPPVVDWVNLTFKGLPEYRPQGAHRGAAELDPIVVIEASETVDEIEGALRHLRELFDAKARVHDKTAKPGEAMRPMRASDVMVLLPAWTKADPIADRMRLAGFACVVEGGDMFFERDEVRLGMAALRGMVEPADGEPVVFLLRGVFGLSLEQLAAHVAAKGSFRFTIPNQPPGPVADALEVLGKVARGRGTRSLSILLDEIFDATRVTAVWSALPDGSSRLANLDKLKSMVREAEQKTTSPLAAVDELRRIEKSIRGKNKDIDRIDDDGDAIRITSLFKAKGLEAPVVVLLCCARKLDTAQHIVNHTNGSIAVRMGLLEPHEWTERKEIEAGHEREERRRWMYVAATRARDQLVICRPPAEMSTPKDGEEATEKPPKATDLLQFDVAPLGLPPRGAHAHDSLVDVGGASVRVRDAEQLRAVAKSTETFPGRDAAIDALLASPSNVGDPRGDAFAAARKQHLRHAKRGCVRWRAAAGEPTKKQWRPGVTIDDTSENIEAAPETVGARGGRVIHAVMERLDLARPHAELVAKGVDLVALLGAQAGLGDELIAKCQKIVERILANPLVDKARHAPERWPEVPFTYSPRPNTVISGTIDLCFPLDESRREWAVFDWKSRVPAKDDPLRVRYEEQLKRYASALLAGLGDVKVTQLEIVGPYPEFGALSTVDDAIVDVLGSLRGPLAALLERGALPPSVGVDVGEPIICTAELCWDANKIAIIPEVTDEQESALRTQGFVVKRELDEEVASLLDLAPLPAEDA